jgi:DNA-binding transcriptional ArsR family regulator
MLPKKSPGDLPEIALEALGNAERRRLIRALASSPKSVGELAAEVPISRPAVSRHLRLLETAGLVAHSPQGTRNVYRLDAGGLQAAAEWLTSFWDEAETRLRLIAENTQGNGRG